MRILELDFGNSGVKWRAIENDIASPVGRCYYTGDDFSALRFDRFDRVRVASVLAEERTRTYLTRLGITAAEIARSDSDVTGFVNGYQYPGRLGIDRWLAALAAYRDSGNRACLVVDMGTAITLDYMNERGVFEGGYIIAGKQLLQAALLKDTDKVRFDASATNQPWPNWPSATTEAVQWGVDFVLHAIVERGIKQAQNRRGSDDFTVYLTGGDASLLTQQFKNTVQYRPDLVLDGLAIALP